MPAHHVEGDHVREKLWIDIRTILMEHWDPIGVCGESNATDEYDNYIPKIKALLKDQASVEAIMDYLDWVASERMGFTSQREKNRPAADRLIAMELC